MEPNPSNLNLTNALEAIRRGDFSRFELTQACLRQIEQFNPRLNAFAVTSAPSPEEIPSQGRLAGIPIAVKDLIDVAGLPTTAGSPRFFGQQPALKDAFVVEKLKAAGAIILGKTNTHEIALGITGINPHTGPVRNPHDPSRISGGSSSGSAVAVAAGMCLAALGTDTGGSTRIPAALCGVVGLKPTFGRVSLRGILPLSWNLDHVGLLTKSVRDAAILLGVIAGYDPRDPVSINQKTNDYLGKIDAGVSGWNIALAVGEYIEQAESEVLDAVTRAARLISAFGAHIHEVEIPILPAAAEANSQMVIADAAAFHRERLENHPDWFGADVLARLQKGRSLTATDYALARRTQSEIRRYFEIFFERYDLLILPTTAVTAAPIEGLDSAAYAPRLTRFTGPFNLAGLPALSLPAGKTKSGLPIGLQLVGPAWGEARLLQAAQAFEKISEQI
jgi:aspartyl-tRNA(Asn)/glutamyl-tRNA(Gln) amidotransferase subunit A